MTPKPYRLLRRAALLAVLALVSLAPLSARADFFDDMRQTFTRDIPHFFQDDIPCAFGGQPTSGTKSSCKAPAHPAKPAADQSHAVAPPESLSAPSSANDTGARPPSAGR